MEKFGIFKLLSALSNVTKSGLDNKPTDLNGLNGLSGAIKNFISKPVKESAPEPEKAPPLPKIVSPMLNTIKSHDEFVKRVIKNNEKKSET